MNLLIVLRIIKDKDPPFNMIKSFLLIVATIGLIACQPTHLPIETPNEATPLSAQDRRMPSADAAQIEKDIRYLASDSLKGRVTGTNGIDEASSYIAGRFRDMNVTPLYNTYMDKFNVDGKTASNVVASIEGADPVLKNEIIVIGAHYDHISIQGSDTEDKIANGANDNAAGTVAVLALAEKLKHLSNKRSVVFALFSAEELGLLGSKHLAKRMKSEGLNIVAMINFEMIGIPMQDKPFLTYLTGHDTSNMADVLNQHSKELAVTGKLPLAVEYNLFKRSDNYPFFLEFAIPAQTISTFDFTNFAHYHQVGDEADLIDFDHMASVVNHVAPGILDMVNKDKLRLSP